MTGLQAEISCHRKEPETIRIPTFIELVRSINQQTIGLSITTEKLNSTRIFIELERSTDQTRDQSITMKSLQAETSIHLTQKGMRNMQTFIAPRQSMECRLRIKVIL
jgi:hypothetical protein